MDRPLRRLRRRAALAAVLLAACRPGPPAGDGERLPAPRRPACVRVPDLGERAYRHVETLVGFGPRHSGSAGWARALEHIERSLADAGLAPRRDQWFDRDEGLAFVNVVATLPGSRADRIVIGAHHDTKKTTGHPDPEHNFEFVGANDSASGVGLLLALAEWLAEQDERGATYEFVFFDGEESVPFDWDIERALFGSRRYVAAYERALREAPDTPRIRAMILLDMVGAEDLSIDEETNSDERLRAIVRRAAEGCDHERWFFEHRQRVTDDHLPFLTAGIPAIDLIDIADNPQWHTPEDTLEHISAESLRIVGEVVLTALPEVVADFVPNTDRLRLPPLEGR